MTPSAKCSVKPIPDGCHAITPYLIVARVAKLIDFLKQTFDGQVTEKMEAPDGAIRHAEVKIGDSLVMMGEAGGPNAPRPGTLYLYVTDVDAIYRRALEVGARSLSEPKDQFYGDRSCGIEDPSGNHWYIATHIEDVPPDEMQRRAAALR